METDVIYAWADGLSGTSTETDNFDTCATNFFGELIDSDVRRSTNKDFTHFLFDEVMD